MPFSRKDLNEFTKWGVQPFRANHGKPEQIRNQLNSQKDRQHGNWIQRGIDIECTKCSPKHGFYRTPMTEDKHYLLDGEDENGHPLFKILDLSKK